MKTQVQLMISGPLSSFRRLATIAFRILLCRVPYREPFCSDGGHGLTLGQWRDQWRDQKVDRGLIRRSAALTISVLICAGGAAAEEHTINMLTSGESGSMVFEPAFVKVAVGDTVVFNPVAPNQFHNSASQFLPEGAASWSSTFDTEFRLTVETEGVYIYSCVPHQGMGMVGVIQAGAATNLAEAKTAAEELSSKMFQHKERLAAAIAQIN